MTDPTHPKFADDADDAEGHVYINPDADIAGRPDQAVTSPGPDGEDTEGHRIAFATGETGPAPEGLGAFATDAGADEDDTEGHRQIPFAEGQSGPRPDGVRVRVTDDGDDTEGHRHLESF